MNTVEVRSRSGDEPGGLLRPDAYLRRRVYSRPGLVSLEALRDITLGPTAGTGESGNPLTLRRRTPPPPPFGPSDQDHLPPLP